MKINQQLRRVFPLLPAFINTKEGKRWGYINTSGQFIIQPQYEEADDFQQNGLAIARTSGKAGMIDQTGQFVIPPKYDSILPFTEGLAVVIDDDRYKVINEAGQVLTKRGYGLIMPYQDQRAVFADTSNVRFLYGYLDERGNERIPLQFETANDFKDGKALVKTNENEHALINRNGETLQTYPYSFMMSYSEGLIAFSKTFQDKWGYVDEQGRIVIQPQYTYASPFRDGRAVINMAEGIENKYGLIDKNATLLIPPAYNDMTQLGEQRVAVGMARDPERPFAGSRYGVATTAGGILSDFLYDSVGEYQKGLSSVTAGQTTFFIDRSGKRAPSFPIIPGVGTVRLVGGIIQANVDHSLAYYDQTGRPIYQPNTSFPLNNKYRIHIRKYSPNKDYLVYYPHVEGMANLEAQKQVNLTLQQKSKVVPIPPTQLDFGYYGDFSVSFFQKNLLVLKLEGYEYPFGAAHGMPYQVHVPIDLKTGTIYELKDLFKPDSDYVKVISDIIGKQIQAEPQHYFPDQYKGIQPDQPFYVDENSLTIYFEPYEIAAYAFGFPSFTIPFEEIMGLIDVDGSFWRSFRG
ncbi:WG repeat-containing protein [Halalkalibacter flavus]|uniref:WG repeat-containing protein n=1 Tax=Halalkalibacter flavus TaxID=3090668 RepID=UPI002FC92C23